MLPIFIEIQAEIQEPPAIICYAAKNSKETVEGGRGGGEGRRGKSVKIITGSSTGN